MQDSTATRRPPLSAIVCDLACLGLAGWTVLCNAVVLLRGTPLHLRVLAGGAVLAVAAAGLYGWRRRRLGDWLRALDAEPASAAPASPELAREPSVRARIAFLALGAAAAAVFALRGDLNELALIALGFFAASYVSIARSGRTSPQAAERGASEWGLWALGLGCAALALTLHEPNSDDSFYANLAVSVVDFPDRALLAYDTLHGIPDAPIKIIAYGATSIEALTGVVGQLLGLETLVAYHMLMPALVAVLLPLSLARLLRVLDGERWFWAVLAVLILLALDAGGGRGSFQKFAFVRLFQGKAMFASVLAPALLAYGVRFALAPTRVRFVMLTAAQIAALGTTVTAFWAAPVLAMTGVVVGLAPRRRSLATLAAAVASSSYLLALGAFLKLSTMIDAAPSAAAAGEPRDTTRHLLPHAYDMVLGRGTHLAASIALVFVAWPLCRTPLARRFAVVVPLLFFAVAGNPWLVRWFSAATTTTVHWRVLWLLPVPLFAALIASAVIRGGRSLFGGLRVAVYALLLTLFLHHASPRLALSRGSFGRPRPKVSSSALKLARTLIAALPPHRYAAAPPKVSRILPMLNGYSYPLVIKPKYLPTPQDDRKRRVKVTRLLARAKPNGESIAWVLGRLDHYRVEGVIAAHGHGGKGWAKALRAVGFERVGGMHRHEVWVRKLAR
jgi:hypothetical protein